MKAGRRSLLLCEFSSLLGFGKSERVAALVTTTRRATTATTAMVGVFVLLVVGALLVEIRVTRSPRRRRRRWAHRETRESRLITAVRVLRGVHGHSELLLRLLLLGKLEGVDLGRNTTHGATGRERVDLSELLRLEQAHIDILLVCRSDLLLLLLKQLDLLLDRQLFHCRALESVNHQDKGHGEKIILIKGVNSDGLLR